MIWARDIVSDFSLSSEEGAPVDPLPEAMLMSWLVSFWNSAVTIASEGTMGL